MIIYLSLLISLIGLIVYFATEGKPSGAGLYAFAVGLLAFLLTAVPHIIALK